MEGEGKKRIVILADVPIWTLPGMSKYDRMGTYATWLEGLVPAFGKLDSYDIHWVCVSKEIEEDMSFEAEGQHFYVIKRWKKLVSMVTGYFVERWKIRNTIDNLAPDLLHVWGTEDVFALAGGRSSTYPKLFSIQGCVSACVLTAKKPHWLMRLQSMYERLAVKRYLYGTGESSIAVKHLECLNPEMQVTQIDYGVAAEFHSSTWDPGDESVALFVGSVTEAKGIRDFCEASKDLRLSKIRFVVAGSGDIEDELKEAHAGRVEWLGRLSKENLIQLMESAWLIVVPTYADTGPSVLKEARVVGMPVIATDAAGASAYIESGKSGYVISPGDTESLICSILKVCENRSVCVSMGNYRQQELAQILSVDHAVNKFARVYEKLLSGRFEQDE